MLHEVEQVKLRLLQVSFVFIIFYFLSTISFSLQLHLKKPWVRGKSLLHSIYLTSFVTKVFAVCNIFLAPPPLTHCGLWRVKELIVLKLKGNANWNELFWTMMQYVFQL